MGKELAKIKPTALTLPTIDHADSVSLNRESQIVASMLESAIESDDVHNANILLELKNIISRASEKGQQLPTRSTADLRKLTDKFLELVTDQVTVDIEPLRAELYTEIEGLANEL